MATRTEKDSLGEVQVPADALYCAQTQRAVDNFPYDASERVPLPFIHALADVKAACALANADVGAIDTATCEVIVASADEVARGEHDSHFPLSVFQTGSGTSTNLNMCEVLATLASRRAGRSIHPNNDVNASQSSNDVIPTALNAMLVRACSASLLPALARLEEALTVKIAEVGGQVKTGRTHLMDAMPITMGQELGAWRSQVRLGAARVARAVDSVRELAIGGTAVGTGINAPAGFAEAVCRHLSARLGASVVPKEDKFEGLAAQDAVAELSGQLKTVACSFTKIANDLRWMNSGPVCGLGEIQLPALQPGSSIMPGKVNPVIPESVCMVAAQVIGNDAAITIGAQAGSFQLNVMLPLLARNAIQSVRLLATAATLLAEKAIAGFTVNADAIDAKVGRNPVLVTALNPVIGYDKGAEIAKEAFKSGRDVKSVAAERTGLTKEELDRLLDPALLTKGGVVTGGK